MGKKNRKKTKWTPLEIGRSWLSWLGVDLNGFKVGVKMQWKQKDQTCWVIGTGNRSLIIRHYNLSLAEETGMKETEKDKMEEANVIQGRRNTSSAQVHHLSKSGHVRENKESVDYGFNNNKNWITSSGPQSLNPNYGYPVPPPAYGPLYGLSAAYGSPFPRFFYPTLPTNGYRPLQPIEWFNQRIPSNCQIYYAMMPSTQHFTKANINQTQPYYNNSIQFIPYSSSFVANQNPPLEGEPQSNPYIYPGYCYGPATFNQESHVISPSAPTSNSTANIISPKKKRKRKRKRKLRLTNCAEEQGIENCETFDEEDTLSSCTTLAGEDIIVPFENQNPKEPQKVASIADMEEDQLEADGSTVTGSILTTVPINKVLELDESRTDMTSTSEDRSEFLTEVDKLLCDLDTELCVKPPDKKGEEENSAGNRQRRLSRDQLPRLPLVDDLFAINLVDDIVAGAIEAVITNQKVEQEQPKEAEYIVGDNEPEIDGSSLQPIELKTTAETVAQDLTDIAESLPNLQKEVNGFQESPLAEISLDQSSSAVESISEINLNNALEMPLLLEPKQLLPEIKEERDEFLELEETSRGITEEEFDDLLPEDLDDVDDDTDESELRELISRQESPQIQEDGFNLEDDEDKLPTTYNHSNNSDIQNNSFPKTEGFYTPDVVAPSARRIDINVPLRNNPDHHFRPIDWPDRNGCPEGDSSSDDNRERELVTEIVFISETSFMDESHPMEDHDRDEGDNESHLSDFDVEDRSSRNSLPVEADDDSTMKISNPHKSAEEPSKDSLPESSRDLSSEPLVKFLMEPTKGPSAEALIQSLKLPAKEVLADSDSSVKSSVTSSKELLEKLMAEPLFEATEKSMPEKSLSNPLKETVEKSSENLMDSFTYSSTDVTKESLENPPITSSTQIFKMSPTEKSDESLRMSTDSSTDLLNDPVKKSSMDHSIVEDEELLDERYMDIEDHQQFYDPLKYKDYYQICTNLDVPDSPLLTAGDNTTPKALPTLFDVHHPPPKPPRLRSRSREGSAAKENPNAVQLPEALLTNPRGEIVVHELDDVSECGSEDVDTIGHRYQTGESGSSNSQKHGYVNQLSLAAELLKTQQEIPFDDEFKPLAEETALAATSRNVHCLQKVSPVPHSNRHIYDSYYGNARPIEMEPRCAVGKEVSDSGVQSEEDSADEGDEGKRSGVREGGRPTAYGNFGSKAKPLSAMLKGKSDPLCLCCNVM